MTAQGNVIGGKRGQVKLQSGGELLQRLLETRQVEPQIVKLGNGLQGIGHRNLKTTSAKLKAVIYTVATALARVARFFSGSTA
ncbi:hypothetical protein IC615_19850 [Serratia ureilytica]